MGNGRRVMLSRFSIKQKCWYYGTKLLVYSMLILLFSHHSIQVTEEPAESKDANAVHPEAKSEFNSKVSTQFDEQLENIKTTPAYLTTTKAAGKETTTPCVKAAIEQFPHFIFGPKPRKYGAIIFHILICIYSFLGLAITCDNYFVKSLDLICEAVSEGSIMNTESPRKLGSDNDFELFDSEDDNAQQSIGDRTKAIRKMKLSADVAGATFMAAGSSAPELATVIIGVFLAQDDIGISGVIGSAVFNILFVIAVCGLFATSALYLNWWPLVRDCFFYTLSILIMLIAIANERVNWFESVLLLVTYGIYCVALYYNEFLEMWVSKYPPFNTLTASTNAPSKEIEDPNSHLEDHKTPRYSTDQEQYQKNSIDAEDVPRPSNGNINVEHNITYYKPKEPRPSEVNPLQMPMNVDKFHLYKWYAVWPIHFLTQATTPDCQKERYRHLYPLTFIMSMVWISFYSYIMVWMITVIGHTMAIPDTVMGLTFVAAGVSVPDALSSLAVVKEGYGDMAVSNAVGSNVFDILVCLGLPWFLKTGIFNPGSTIKVYSKGLTYSTISLLSTVVMLILATHWNGWKLDKKFGVILMLGYFVFIIFASLYELNVFGDMNPPVCFSEY